MKQKKILVLSNMYPSSKSKTFGIFIKNQVEALKEKDLRVDVIAVKNPEMGKKNVIKKYFSWFLKTAVNLLTKGKSYDVVHAHYVFPTGILALMYKMLFGKRMVVTAHGGDIDRMARKSPAIRKLTTHILRKSDHVIAVGHELHSTIRQEFHVPEGKISIINMGVNRQVFAPVEKEEARKKLNLPSEKKVILFVGNLIRQKGMIELIEAYELLKNNTPDIALYLIGSSKDVNFRKELEGVIKEKNLRDIHILDPVPQKEVARWMSAADVFVLPSYIEGFGLVALEAMSCHVPVVGSRVGGLRYLLEGEKGVLVEPKNSSSLYEGIEEVLRDPQLAGRLVRNGEQCAAENDQQKLIQKVLEVYGLAEKGNQ